MIKGLMFFVRFSWAHEKRYLVYRVLNQFIASMIPLVAVVMPRCIINELMGARRISYLGCYVGILAGYTMAATAVSHWLLWTGFTYKIKVAQDFNTFLHEKTVKADYADLESSHYLEMKEKAEKFLFGNWKGFSYVLDKAIDIIGQLFTLVGVVVIVASLNPFMVLLFTGLVLLSGLVQARVQRKQADMRLKLTEVERRTVYYDQIMGDFTYGKEIRINQLGDWLMRRENAHWQRGYDMYRKHNALAVGSGVFNAFTGLVQQAVSYAYLLSRVIGGFITLGDFSMYVGGVAAFSGALRSLVQNITEVGEYRKYYEAIEEYLQVPARMRENKRLPVPDGDWVIEFKNVSFTYPGQTGYALKNVNLILAPGMKLSIVGENGAGKSTFVKLLCRIYDPTEGEILLNGTPVCDIDYDQYMSLFSAVFQDYKLYALSLKDNVALAGSDTADSHNVEAALRKAGLGDKLDSLPHGIDTLVYRNFDGEGFEPSGGEGQKIVLARAIYRDAPVVVLDEPAAALDPRAEYEMYQRFDTLVEGKTAVYISHRLSSARFCDRIAVFSGGEIVEYGTHDELCVGGGLYAELWRMQAQYYDTAPAQRSALA